MKPLVTAIGLMSGTSLDGIDIALIQTDGQTEVVYQASSYKPYTPDFQKKLKQLATADIPLDDVMRLEKEFTQKHAGVIKEFLEENNLSYSNIDVIGFHGQTIRHLPEESLTWQMGNPQGLAEAVGIPVVGDFRKRDMAAKGEGAPLAPLYHQALLAKKKDVPNPCAVLNLGGVANLTYLGEREDIIATDTGPASGLLDIWMQEKTGQMYDEDGACAARGQVHQDIIDQALQDIPFFQRLFPRSADRYEFDAVNINNLSVEDGAATLVALTVAGVRQAVEALPSTPLATYVCGGGAHNTYLMQQLESILPNLQPISALALREDSLEAECFAWLAVRHLKGLSTSVPGTTGCTHATIGGVLAPCIRS